MAIFRSLLLTLFSGLFMMLQAQVRIANSITSEHVPFRDQRYLIIPPKGFVGSMEGNAFVDSTTKHTIILSELSFGVEDILPALEAEPLKASNITLISKEPILFNSLEGFFMTMEENKGLKQVLVFGNTDITVVLEGNTSFSNADSIAAVKKAILSLTPMFGGDIIPYSLQTQNTPFLLAEEDGWRQVYTLDGIHPTEHEEKSTFVAEAYKKEFGAYNRMMEVNNALKNLPLLEHQLEDDLFDLITINGISGYEVYANGVDETGDQVKVYMVMLFMESNIYQMYGVTTAENRLQDFRKLAYSFQLNRP